MHPRRHVDCVQLSIHIPTLPPPFLPAGASALVYFVFRCIFLCLVFCFRRLSCYVSLFHKRWLSPRARTLLACNPFSLVALDSTLPSLCACESPVRMLLVPPRPDPPTRRLSAPAPYPRTYSCLYLHWGRREAPSPLTLLVAALPKAGIVELVAASTLEIDIPSLQGALGALLLLG